MMPPRKFWTSEADATLVANYRDRGATWLAKQLGRTRLAIYQRAAKLGLCDRPKFASDDELLAVIRELHPQGFTDSEMKAVACDRFGCKVNRHRMGILRRQIGLGENKLSARSRQRVREKTREQLQAAGYGSLAKCRSEQWNSWKRDLGWPETLTVRAVQSLELFYRHGHLTRIQLCELLGVSAKKRTAIERWDK